MQQVKIGDKSAMHYALIALEILQKRGRVLIIAMGKKISKAVDVAEITKRMLREMNIYNINDSVSISSREVESRAVSCIEIELKRCVEC